MFLTILTNSHIPGWFLWSPHACLCLLPSDELARLASSSPALTFHIHWKFHQQKSWLGWILQTFAEWALGGSLALMPAFLFLTSLLIGPRPSPAGAAASGSWARARLFFGRGGWTRVCDRPDSAQTRGTRGAVWPAVRQKKKKTRRD